jgi:hypothetical protein
MKRANHEDGTTEKDTYCALGNLYNSTEPEAFIDIVDFNLGTDVKSQLATNPFICEADLTQFIPTLVDGSAFKKFIREMFVLRKKN